CRIFPCGRTPSPRNPDGTGPPDRRVRRGGWLASQALLQSPSVADAEGDLDSLGGLALNERALCQYDRRIEHVLGGEARGEWSAEPTLQRDDQDGVQLVSPIE